jgi:hypothetical protein
MRSCRILPKSLGVFLADFAEFPLLLLGQRPASWQWAPMGRVKDWPFLIAPLLTVPSPDYPAGVLRVIGHIGPP